MWIRAVAKRARVLAYNSSDLNQAWRIGLSVMEQRILDIERDVVKIIERDFAGLYSGEVGLSSIMGGQSSSYFKIEIKESCATKLPWTHL